MQVVNQMKTRMDKSLSVSRVESFVDKYSTPSWAIYDEILKNEKQHLVNAVRRIIVDEGFESETVLVPQGSFFGKPTLKSDYDCDAFYNGPDESMSTALWRLRKHRSSSKLLCHMHPIDTSTFTNGERVKKEENLHWMVKNMKNIFGSNDNKASYDLLKDYKAKLKIGHLKKLASLSFTRDELVVGSLKIAYELRDFYWRGYKEYEVFKDFDPIKNTERFYKEKIFGWGSTLYDNSSKVDERNLRRKESINLSIEAISKMREEVHYNPRCRIIDLPEQKEFQHWCETGLKKYSS